MIEIKLKKTKLQLDFTFVAVVTIFLTFDKTGYGVMSILASILHECAHIIVMILEGSVPRSICFYGGGIRLQYAHGVSPSARVLFAGSFTNFALFLALIVFSDYSSIYPLIFAFVNLLVGLFNLLPIGYLDGSRLLEIFLIKNFKITAAMKTHEIISKIFTVILIILSVFLIYKGVFNFSMLVLFIYLTVISNINLI